jgi:hypothetical protein
MSPSLDTRETRAVAFEIKFFVDSNTAGRVRHWARTRLDRDPNAAGASGDEYRVTSLYLDTSALDVFQKRASYGRGKYRIRRYGDAPEVFLERKLRRARQLSKRRTAVGLEEIDRFVGHDTGTSWAGRWFHRRLAWRRLAPTCQVSYTRTARVAMVSSGPIRLTLDDDLRVLPTQGWAFVPGAGTPILSGRHILELKYTTAMPAIFKHLAEEFALTPRAMSKYRLGMSALRFGTIP